MFLVFPGGILVLVFLHLPPNMKEDGPSLLRLLPRPVGKESQFREASFGRDGAKASRVLGPANIAVAAPGKPDQMDTSLMLVLCHVWN